MMLPPFGAISKGPILEPALIHYMGMDIQDPRGPLRHLVSEGLALGPGLRKGDHHLQLSGEMLNRHSLRMLLRLPADVTDHELVLKGLERFGVDFLRRINGPFCIAWYNTKDGLLTLARGIAGLRPLWWYEGEHILLFSKELPSLLDLPQVPVEPQPERIAEYMVFQNVAAGNTLYRGIMELLPGEVLIWGPSHPSRRMLNLLPPLEERPSGPAGGSEGLKSTAWKVLRAAVKRSIEAMPSRVSASIFLSGGVDSSLMALLLRSEAPLLPLKAMTVSSPGYKHDESTYAKRVAARLGIQWMEIPLDAGKFAARWVEIVQRLRLPLISTNQVPWWLLCGESSDTDTLTAFCGEGADGWISGGLYGGELQELRRNWKRRPHLCGRTVVLCRMHLLNNPQLICELLDVKLDLEPRLALWERIRSVNGRTSPESLASVYHVLTFGDRLLVRADMAASCHGLQLALPFMDLKWIGWVSSLPFHLRNPRGEKKAFLKELCATALDPTLAYRRKIGFTFPIRTWIRDSSCCEMRDLKGILTDRTTLSRGLYRRKELVRAVEERLRGKGKIQQDWLLWSLINVELWLRAIGV
jgi:asparagine synthase (glutamine-hydrolysing)